MTEFVGFCCCCHWWSLEMFVFEVWVSCFASVYFSQRGPCRSERTGVCNALCMFSFGGKEHFDIDWTGVRCDILCVCVFSLMKRIRCILKVWWWWWVWHFVCEFNFSRGPQQTVVCLVLCIYIYIWEDQVYLKARMVDLTGCAYLQFQRRGPGGPEWTGGVSGSCLRHSLGVSTFSVQQHLISLPPEPRIYGFVTLSFQV